jgi:hypothetical protein
MTSHARSPGGRAGARGVDQTGSQDRREDTEATAFGQVQLILHARDHSRRWDGLLDGERIIDGSRDPEHDSARVLVARGITGTAATIDASTGATRMRFGIERFASTCTVERANGLSIERWRPMPSEISAVRSQSTVSEPEGRETADEAKRPSLVYRRRVA